MTRAGWVGTGLVDREERMDNLNAVKIAAIGIGGALLLFGGKKGSGD